jgi:hypothetical protein
MPRARNALANSSQFGPLQRAGLVCWHLIPCNASGATGQGLTVPGKAARQIADLVLGARAGEAARVPVATRCIPPSFEVAGLSAPSAPCCGARNCSSCAASIARHRAHRAPLRHQCNVALAQDAGNGRIDFPIFPDDRRTLNASEPGSRRRPLDPRPCRQAPVRRTTPETPRTLPA